MTQAEPHPPCLNRCSHPGVSVNDPAHNQCDGPSEGHPGLCECPCHWPYAELLSLANNRALRNYRGWQEAEDQLDRIPKWILKLLKISYTRQTGR